MVIGSFSHKRPLFPKKTSWLPILHLSLLQTTLQYFFFYIGLGKTSGVKASIIEALNVFVALFVACLLFKQEKLKQNKIIGSILGFAGVFLVEIWGSRGTGSSLGDIGIGEICVFISTVAYAFSSVYLRKYSEQEEPFVLSGYQFIVGGITLILLGFLMCIFLPGESGIRLCGYDDRTGAGSRCKPYGGRVFQSQRMRYRALSGNGYRRWHIRSGVSS